VQVIIRFRLDAAPGVPADGDAAEAALHDLVRVLARRPGFVQGTLGQAADHPALWSIVTEWTDLGSYRRSLSAYDVKVAFGPVQRWIIDEPSVYELVSRLEYPSVPPD
jgi:hypothetical protein